MHKYFHRTCYLRKVSTYKINRRRMLFSQTHPSDCFWTSEESKVINFPFFVFLLCTHFSRTRQLAYDVCTYSKMIAHARFGMFRITLLDISRQSAESLPKETTCLDRWTRRSNTRPPKFPKYSQEVIKKICGNTQIGSALIFFSNYNSKWEYSYCQLSSQST